MYVFVSVSMAMSVSRPPPHWSRHISTVIGWIVQKNSTDILDPQRMKLMTLVTAQLFLLSPPAV